MAFYLGMRILLSAGDALEHHIGCCNRSGHVRAVATDNAHLCSQWPRQNRKESNWISLQINAETTAGGIAHWATSLVAGTLRTNATDWTAAYTPYVDGIIKATVPNEVTSGGPVLGNLTDFLFVCGSLTNIVTVM